MTHLSKRFKLAKHGGSFIVTLALSLGANAMEQEKCGAKACAPVDEAHVHAPESQELATEETRKIEHEKLTIKEVTTTFKTREQECDETIEMVYNNLPPVEEVIETHTVVIETRRPCDKGVHTTVCDKTEKQCDQAQYDQTQCAQEEPVVQCDKAKKKKKSRK